jgi:hypothetical protein
MSKQQRIVVPLEQAVELLEVDKAGLVRTFHQVGEQRAHAKWAKAELVEAMEFYSQQFGGVELSGEIARRHHYGLTIHRGDIVKQLPRHLANKLPLGWLFMQTKEGVCVRCGGKGKTARQAFQILPDKCGDCGGKGTYPKPKDNIFAAELRRMEEQKK